MKRVLHLVIVSISVFGCAVLANALQLTPKKDIKKPLWGYVDESDKWVVKPKYDSAAEFTEAPNGKQRATVTSKGLTGFIDETGKPLGPGVKIESIRPVRNNLMFVTIKGKQGLMDYDGNFIVKPELESVVDFGEEGYMVIMKGKSGVLAHSGSFTVDPLYDAVDSGTEGYFIINKGGKYGIMDRSGAILLEPKDFTGVEKSSENLWKVSKSDKVGFFDAASKTVIIPAEYSELELPVSTNIGDLFVAKKGDKTGVIDSKNQVIAEIDCSSVVVIPTLGILMYNKNNELKKGRLFTDIQPRKMRNVTESYKGAYRQVSGTIDSKPSRTNIDVLLNTKGELVCNSPLDISTIKVPGETYDLIKTRQNQIICDQSTGEILTTFGSGILMSAVGWIRDNEYVWSKKSGKFPVVFGENGHVFARKKDGKCYDTMSDGIIGDRPFDVSDEKKVGNIVFFRCETDKLYYPLNSKGEVGDKGVTEMREGADESYCLVKPEGSTEWHKAFPSGEIESAPAAQNAYKIDSRLVQETETKAHEGDLEAISTLAGYYYNGQGVERNYNKAIEWATKGASQGDLASEVILAQCYYEGTGTAKNLDKAKEYAQKAADKGDARGMGILATCFMDKKDKTNAYSWAQRSADKNDSYGQEVLGRCYFNPHDIKYYTDSDKVSTENKKKAAELFKKSAEQGNINGMCDYSWVLCNGEGISTNLSEAIKVAQKVTELAPQYYLGWRRLGYAHLKNNSYYSAIENLEKAVALGDKECYTNLGYAYGKSYKPYEAVKWYKKAAEAGDTYSMFKLAYKYNEGEGVTKDYSKAVYWYRKAANLGDVDAMNNLGVCYANGEGVAKNIPVAMYWWKKAVENGETENALNNYNRWYERGYRAASRP